MDQPYQVLIFDDDIALAEMLRDYFLVSCSCRVTLVHEESQFWPALRAGSFDILFLDYQLHNTTGLTILEKMGAEGCQVPTVMMTGHGSEKVAARAIQLGAIDYLIKSDLSFSISMLPNLLQKAIQLGQMRMAMQNSRNQIEYQALLLENMRDALVVWNQNGIITYWNAAAEELYGRTQAEMIGQPALQKYFRLFSPALQPTDGLWKERDKLRSERIFKLRDSEQVWVSSQIQPLYDSAHQLCGTMDVTRDITLTKAEHQQLERSRHLQERILATNPNVIYIFNLRTNQIEYISPKIEWLLRIQPGEALPGRNPFFFNLVDPKDLPVLVRHYNSLTGLKDGDTSEIEYRVKLKPDDWRWLKNRETVFSRDGGGRIIEIIGTCEDITTRKYMEEKLLQRLDGEKLISNLSATFIPRPNPEADAAADQTTYESLRVVTEFFGMEYGTLFMNQQGELHNTIRYSRSEPGLNTPSPLLLDVSEARFPWLAGEIKRQTLILIQSPDSLPPEASNEFAELVRNHVKSALILPLVHQDELVGLILFGTVTRELHWDTEFETMFQSFARVILKAILQHRAGLDG